MRRNRKRPPGSPGGHRRDQPSAARDRRNGAHQPEGDGAPARGRCGRRICRGRPRLACLGETGNRTGGQHAVSPPVRRTRPGAVPGKSGDLQAPPRVGDRKDLCPGETPPGQPGSVPGADIRGVGHGPRRPAVRRGMFPGTPGPQAGAGTEDAGGVARPAGIRDDPRQPERHGAGGLPPRIGSHPGKGAQGRWRGTVPAGRIPGNTEKRKPGDEKRRRAARHPGRTDTENARSRGAVVREKPRRTTQ